MNTLHVLFAAGWPPLLSWFWWQKLVPSLGMPSVPPWVIGWFLSAGTIAGAFLIARHWECAAGAGLSALTALVVWWWRRRKNRRKALRSLGNKAKARLEAMARNMPRIAPRLVPA